MTKTWVALGVRALDETGNRTPLILILRDAIYKNNEALEEIVDCKYNFLYFFNLISDLALWKRK